MSKTMDGTTTKAKPATTTALSISLILAAACWVIVVRQIDGMHEEVMSDLDSFQFFIGVWVAMMAAMMLPAAIPAVVRRGHVGGAGVVPAFVVSYLLVWTAVGAVFFVVYRSRDTVAAGILVILAGLYEL